MDVLIKGFWVLWGPSARTSGVVGGRLRREARPTSTRTGPPPTILRLVCYAPTIVEPSEPPNKTFSCHRRQDRWKRTIACDGYRFLLDCTSCRVSEIRMRSREQVSKEVVRGAPETGC